MTISLQARLTGRIHVNDEELAFGKSVPDDLGLQKDANEVETIEDDGSFFDPAKEGPAYLDVSKRHAAKDLESLSFEERVEHLKATIVRHPLHREIHYKTLRFCLERHTLPEVEEFIASCPEFPSAVQSPYYLLQFLIKGGGTIVYELDENGEIVLPEQKEGLTEDEIDDLVAQIAFETNEFGRELAERMSPKNRLLELLSITSDYYDTFIEVLDFLNEKRSFGDVDDLLRGRDVLMAGRDPHDRPIQPSVFVDKLEKAGGIVWKDGWIITEEAKELLVTLKERRS